MIFKAKDMDEIIREWEKEVKTVPEWIHQQQQKLSLSEGESGIFSVPETAR